MWSYTNMYHALVDNVVEDLRDGMFKLNRGIVAIAELMPRDIVHFTLRNLSNNHSKMWTTTLVDETIAHLTACARIQINRYKEELQ